MVTLAGEALMAVFWCMLVPTLFVPLASLADGRSRAGVAFVLANLASMGAAFSFAYLAVDLDAPSIHGPWYPSVFALVLTAGGLAILRWGAGSLARAMADTLRPIVTTTGKATGVFVFAMAFVQFTVVVLRYVFGWNSILLQESVIYLHGATFLLAAGYALLTNDHVRVDIFYGTASPRRRAFVDLLGIYLFLFPFCVLITATAAPYVANSWAALEGSTEQSGLQAMFLLKSLIPAFAILLLAAGFVLATDCAELMRGRTRDRATS